MSSPLIIMTNNFDGVEPTWATNGKTEVIGKSSIASDRIDLSIRTHGSPTLQFPKFKYIHSVENQGGASKPNYEILGRKGGKMPVFWKSRIF
jgi:hypothetical protein